MSTEAHTTLLFTVMTVSAIIRDTVRWGLTLALVDDIEDVESAAEIETEPNRERRPVVCREQTLRIFYRIARQRASIDPPLVFLVVKEEFAVRDLNRLRAFPEYFGNSAARRHRIDLSFPVN